MLDLGHLKMTNLLTKASGVGEVWFFSVSTICLNYGGFANTGSSIMSAIVTDREDQGIHAIT